METPGPGRRPRRPALLAVLGPVGSEEERAALRRSLERAPVSAFLFWIRSSTMACHFLAWSMGLPIIGFSTTAGAASCHRVSEVLTRCNIWNSGHQYPTIPDTAPC